MIIVHRALSALSLTVSRLVSSTKNRLARPRTGTKTNAVRQGPGVMWGAPRGRGCSRVARLRRAASVALLRLLPRCQLHEKRAVVAP